jgi:hypothetical protein
VCTTLSLSLSYLHHEIAYIAKRLKQGSTYKHKFSINRYNDIITHTEYCIIIIIININTTVILQVVSFPSPAITNFFIFLWKNNVWLNNALKLSRFQTESSNLTIYTVYCINKQLTSHFFIVSLIYIHYILHCSLQVLSVVSSTMSRLLPVKPFSTHSSLLYVTALFALATSSQPAASLVASNPSFSRLSSSTFGILGRSLSSSSQTSLSSTTDQEDSVAISSVMSDNSMTPASKLKALRSKMKELSIDCYIVPTDDPHLSGKSRVKSTLR